MSPGAALRLVGLGAAGAGGVLLGAAVGVVAAVRRDRPMHWVGRTYHAVVRWTPTEERAGVPWLDEGRERSGLVRFSRGAGLPAWLPDVQGVALRLDEPDGGHTDLLFSSTGLRGPARYALVPRWSVLDGPSSTVMPLRGPRGPLLLAVDPQDPAEAAAGDGAHPPHRALGGHRRRDATAAPDGSTWTLLWSGATGPWRPFAVLSVGPDAGREADRRTRFDPIGATPPGLPSPRWAAALRDPAYRAARLLGRRPSAVPRQPAA